MEGEIREKPGGEGGELTGCCSMIPLGLMTPMGSITAGCADICLSFLLELLK